ncbi:hypothetical protein INT48_002017 [Thamnidium elegans]|uniref:Uncharacterized protein n=1 Tax=Thamnidium elegans TaxID=101142 RepID=A0A8H7W1X3_9FUNG|nr:hypothetical protein INT48_002017 [Thamnidium elegans]
MKSFSIISTLLFVCILALVQVWATPVESEAVETNEVTVASAEDQAFNEWYNAAYQQSARPLVARDVRPNAPWAPFPPYPPPPTFPPYPPPPTFPPFPPRW